MPVGELFFNDIDTYTEYGLSMTSGGLSALMTPPPNKELIENKSRLEHGKRVVVDNVKVDERDLTLPVHITAKSKEDFLAKYSKLCAIFSSGKIDIRTKYEPTVVYRTIYLNCTQYSEYRGQMAKFSLKLNEPNPTNRSL